MSYYTEAIIKHIITNVATEGKEVYQKFFFGALKKFGVSSPVELSKEKKRDFFNYIDNNYKAKNEEAPDGWEGTVKAMKDNDDIDNPYALAHWMKNKGYASHKKEFVEYMKLKRHQYSEASNMRDKSDYYSAAMNSLDKYFLNLAAVPAPKKAKKISKLMTMLQKIFFTKDESVNEAEVTLPAGVRRFMSKFIAALKGSNLNRKRQIAVLGGVVDSMGIDPSKLMQIITKIKRGMNVDEASVKKNIYESFTWKNRKFGERLPTLDDYKKLKEASVKDRDVLLDGDVWMEDPGDIATALRKDRKVSKHIGNDDINVYFDDNELVAGGDSGNTIVAVENDWTLADLKKAILKKNPRKWQESIGEARTINVEPNWEGVWRFFKHIEKTSPGQWKKMKGDFRDSWITLQRMADKKGWVSESVLEVAMPLGSYLEHAIADVAHLMDVVKSEHAEDAYSSPKKSGKLLIAVQKLLKKVK